VVAEPARPSEAVSVTNADDDTHGLICGSCMQTAYGHVLFVLLFGSTACGCDLFTANFLTLHACTHAADRVQTLTAKSTDSRTGQECNKFTNTPGIQDVTTQTSHQYIICYSMYVMPQTLKSTPSQFAWLCLSSLYTISQSVYRQERLSHAK